MTTTKPDVDLTDGAFYAGDSRAVYQWMRENEPVFRDRNGLAAAATYAGGDRGRAQPRAVLQRGRHPARPAGRRDDDRDGRSATSVAAQARQLRIHPQTREGPGGLDRFPVRHADRRGVRARRVRLRLGPRRAAADGGHRRHARGASRTNARCSSSGPTIWSAS